MRKRITALAAQLRADATAYLVLAVAILASIATYLYVERAIGLQQQARFDSLTTHVNDSIHDRIEASVATLRSTRALFDVAREPTRREFGAFVHGLELDRFYPGIQGIGYAKVIRPDELQQHERAVRAEGFPQYRVWPAGQRDLYTSIVYLEPFDWENQRAFGYDMSSEPVRREAMQRARDTGLAACSARVELVQEVGEGRQPGFLMYQAVYGPGPREVPNSRRVLGYVYAPFRAVDLLGATLQNLDLASVVIEVYDGDHVQPGELLFASRPTAERPGGPGRLTRMEVAGRLWTLRVAAGEGFAPTWEEVLPRGVFVIAIVIALGLFMVTRRETRSREEAERAARRSTFLADAGRILASSFDYRMNLAAVAARAAQEVADWCVVLVIEPDGPVRLIGHRDPADQEVTMALSGIRLDPEARFGAAAALASEAPYVARSVDDAALVRIASSPRQLEALRGAGLRSIVTVPLRARGESLGAITFASCDPSRTFDAADVAMVEDLGRMALAAIDTARLFQRAQQAVRLRDEFLSIASHELKTPLTSLALQTDSLIAATARGRVPEQVGQKAEVIRRNVDRLTRLIENLLDISRIGAGRLDLDLEDVDLCELVRDVAARFEDEAARSHCALRVETPEPAVGRWDRLRLDQVVTNLLSNALKYGPGRPVTVTVRPQGESVVLTVRDEGIGIPVDAQRRIFERFERAVTSRNYGGFGLGLWIVRRIVEALGGSITVESEPGRGATFTVVLGRKAPAERRMKESGFDLPTATAP